MDNQAEYDELQRELGDLLRLAVVCDHVRWVVLASPGAVQLLDGVCAALEGRIASLPGQRTAASVAM